MPLQSQGCLTGVENSGVKRHVQEHVSNFAHRSPKVEVTFDKHALNTFRRTIQINCSSDFFLLICDRRFIVDVRNVATSPRVGTRISISITDTAPVSFFGTVYELNKKKKKNHCLVRANIRTIHFVGLKTLRILYQLMFTLGSLISKNEWLAPFTEVGTLIVKYALWIGVGPDLNTWYMC